MYANNSALFALVMALSLLTLNIGGCSAPTLNKITSNPVIVLLQETYTLNEKSRCWNVWSHTPFCSPGPTRRVRESLNQK